MAREHRYFVYVLSNLNDKAIEISPYGRDDKRVEMTWGSRDDMNQSERIEGKAK